VCLQALKYAPKFSHERQKHLLGKGGLSQCFKQARKKKKKKKLDSHLLARLPATANAQ
jgi:hypothetical protein